MSDRAQVFDRISGVVGETPLVRLHRSVEGLDCEAFAKLEFLNPMGSVKDRIARFMVKKALESGELRPGGTIVESSSGNTAMGFAMMAVLEGLRCVMVVRRQTSKEKLDCLRAMGVDLVLVDGDLPPDDPESYNRTARRLAGEHPDWWFPDQHNNRLNNEAHYRTTGPEIREQMDGRIDFLQIGRGRTAAIHRVSDREAFEATRELARLEAILAGGSSGAALWGVRQVAKKHPGSRIVTLFPDSGSRYLSTIFNDQWLRERGLA